MKIIGFTMITDPEYRQDPWDSAIRSALEVFDLVVVVYGKESDIDLINKLKEEYPSRILSSYLNWPQPEWSYEELALHLNRALDMARGLNPDWVVKFDSDYIFHENQRTVIRQGLIDANAFDKVLASFEKMQFFLSTRGYEKGKIPIAINCRFPNVCYGLDQDRYTDLCQPIICKGRKVKNSGGTYEIPKGRMVHPEAVYKLSAHIYNYDYTFKTYARAQELLYHFDRSHAKWWGAGYSGKELKDITPKSAMEDYLGLLTGRVKKCKKIFKLEDHPKHIQERLRNLTKDQMGHSLWGKIKL